MAVIDATGLPGLRIVQHTAGGVDPRFLQPKTIVQDLCLVGRGRLRGGLNFVHPVLAINEIQLRRPEVHRAVSPEGRLMDSLSGLHEVTALFGSESATEQPQLPTEMIEILDVDPADVTSRDHTSSPGE